MLFKILDNIRSKPKPVRDQYALGIAVFCTLAIGGVWSLSLPSRFGDVQQVASLASSTNAAPFTNFFTQLKNQFSGVKEALDEFPKATTTPQSTASTTEAALELKLTDENKDQLNGTTTPSGSKIKFGTGASTTNNGSDGGEGVIVASSSSSR